MGADVRIDGRSIGIAPVEHNLDAGDYDVELIDDGRVVRADRVSVGVGRTVVLLAPAAAESAARDGATDAGAASPAASWSSRPRRPLRQPTRTWCRTPPVR